MKKNDSDNSPLPTVHCPLEERLENALIKGVGDHLEEDLKEALKEYPRAVILSTGR